VKNIQKLNERVLQMGVEDGASWHKQYKDSAYIFMGKNHPQKIFTGEGVG
jgi:hypothetical protein